ncbi:MAG: 30S ribosomal protein S30e [Candidatus Thorarchaeota archaeon]
MPGSHGSLTKAGKVRESTPKVKGRERHTPIPRIRNKRNYVKRVVKGMTIGVGGRDKRR